MPNQRATNKRKIGLWLTKEEQERFRALAASQGTNVTDLIKQAIEHAYQESKKNHQGRS
jgi:predicted DNA-binding protein